MALITGAAAAWLEQNREELNTRFRMMRRRFPQLDSAAFSQLLIDVLQPIQGEPQLFSSLYDVALFHSGRGVLQSGSGLSTLLRESFAALQPFLREQPKYLPGALSNVVENVKEKGALFARQLVSVSKHLTNSQQLLDAGAILAWRLGEARLREKALKLATSLPGRAVLEALCLSSWPDEALPMVLLSLQANAWRDPASLFTDETMRRLPSLSPSERATLRHQVMQTPLTPPSDWRRIARLGDFIGFGGHFLSSPTLLQHEQSNKHQLFIESAGKTYVINADVFGYVCRAEEIDDPTPSFASPIKDKKKATTPTLFIDGSLQTQGSSFKVPLAKGASSYVLFDGMLVFSSQDSFRLSLLAPHQERV